MPKRVHFASSPRVFDAKPTDIFKNDLTVEQFSDSEPEESLLKTTQYSPPLITRKAKKTLKLLVFFAFSAIIIGFLLGLHPDLQRQLYQRKDSRIIRDLSQMDMTSKRIFSMEDISKEEQSVQPGSKFHIVESCVLISFIGLVLYMLP